MKLIKSIAFAWEGLKTCFAFENNFKIHVLLGFTAILVGIGLRITAVEWVVIIFSIALVIVMEMMNTAVERLCDLIHKEFNPEIKVIKDIAAGAVFISAISSLVTGGIIFLPKIVTCLNTL